MFSFKVIYAYKYLNYVFSFSQISHLDNSSTTTNNVIVIFKVSWKHLVIRYLDNSSNTTNNVIIIFKVTSKYLDLYLPYNLKGKILTSL